MEHGDRKRLGIVIVHFGDQLRTVRCLNSFMKATLQLRERMPFIEASILIVDNSGNFSVEDYGPIYFSVKCFKPRKNLGYAGACYVGRKLLAQESIHIFSNNDVILQKDSLFNLLETMRSLPEVGAIQPLGLATESSKVDSMGLALNPLMHVFSYANYPLKPINEFVLKNGFKVMECFGVDGMLFAIKSEVWDYIGGWDPEFFMYNDDGLISWKLRLGGYKNYVALDSIIYHERGGTARGNFIKEPIFSSYYTSRNKMLSVLYVYNGTWLFTYFFAAALFEFAKNLMLSLKRKTAWSLYYHFKALLMILSKRRHIICQRSKVVRKISDPRYFLKQGYVPSMSTSIAWLFKQRKSFIK